jgi:hypothetical protein
MKSPTLPQSFATIIFLAALAASAFVGPTVRANIIGSVTGSPDGLGLLYSYEVDNRAGTFPVVAWSLDFNFSPEWNPDDLAVGGDVLVPPDWGASGGIPITGVAAQDFFSFFSDVPSGGTLSGFAFTSAHWPDTVRYFEFGPSGEWSTGLTIGPAEVPDGGALWGVELFLCVALLLCHRPRLLNPVSVVPSRTD